MMINNNFINPSFKGYKNIIANDIKDDNFRIAFITGQLNDLDGFKDLSEYKAIKQLHKFDTNNLDDGIFSCIYSKYNSLESLFFNKTPMLWGDELRDLKSEIPPEAYKIEERAFLKTYQLLASITRRMMCNGLCERNYNIGNVCKHALDDFSEIIPKQHAFSLLESGLLQHVPLEKIGLFFNRGIAHTMRDFFK